MASMIFMSVIGQSWGKSEQIVCSSDVCDEHGFVPSGQRPVKISGLTALDNGWPPYLPQICLPQNVLAT